MIYSDPDPALNFPSSRSGSRQKFRIHANPDPDPTYIKYVYLEIIKKKLKFNQKEESNLYLPFTISYYCSPTVQKVQNSQLFICSFTFCWIRNYNTGSGSIQKFRIHADPDPQHWEKLMHNHILNDQQ